MRKVFTACIFLLLTSCLSETSVKPGDSSTFIRYYNGGNNDQGVAMEEATDKGFIILASTKIQKAEADIPNFKIKLIKTDLYGNPVWTKLFPDIKVKNINYTASSLQILPTGGYVITGNDIQVDGTGNVLNSKVLVLTVDDGGNQLKNATLAPPLDATGLPISVTSGRAIAVNTPGNFLVLSTSGTDAMYLAEINKDTFAPTWTIPYSAGETSLSNRLFIDETGKILWSGAATKNGLTGIRMIKTAPNSKFTDFDLLISDPGFSEIATDFCRFGYGYAITGSTNKKTATATAPSTDTDILFRRLGPDGSILGDHTFAFDNQNDGGNSISTTQDGGLIILSSVLSTAINGRGDTDYYLIKVNAFGDQVWTSSFGSKFKDDGITVRQTSDGGYAVLGTTTQGALKIITLSKTDKNGVIP